jgi:hypothetical protein
MCSSPPLGQGFRLPKGKSYLSFNDEFIDTPFDFAAKTNTRIKGALYSYNKERDECQITDSVQSSYQDKPGDTGIVSTKEDPIDSSPQIKIFYSLIPQA